MGTGAAARAANFLRQGPSPPFLLRRPLRKQETGKRMLQMSISGRLHLTDGNTRFSAFIARFLPVTSGGRADQLATFDGGGIDGIRITKAECDAYRSE